MEVTAHYSIIKDHASVNGGTNNLHIARVVNHRLQTVKPFTSKLSIEKAYDRAEKYILKLINNQ